MLPMMRKKIPKRDLKKLEKLFGIKIKLPAVKKTPIQKSLFDNYEVAAEEKEIVAGKRIGRFKLGLMDNFISTFIESNCEKENINDTNVYKSDSIWFWHDQVSDEITQICAMNRFEGKCFKTIGIGSPLKDVVNKVPSLEKDPEAGDTSYSSQLEPGIIFEIQEGLEEDLHGEVGRIECICVFKA